MIVAGVITIAVLVVIDASLVIYSKRVNREIDAKLAYIKQRSRR